MTGKWNETTTEILSLLLKEPRTVDELAEVLQCSRSNVTVPILKLYRKALVERESVEQGQPVVLKNPGKGRRAVQRARRVFVYHVTDAGREKLGLLNGDAR